MEFQLDIYDVVLNYVARIGCPFLIGYSRFSDF